MKVSKLNSIYFVLMLIFLFQPFILYAQNIEIKMKERGVVGNGKFDNWEIIQKAVDEIANAGGGKLIFPQGEFAIYNKSVVIWGNNIELRGDITGGTTIVKKGKVGYFGECIDIAGKIKGYQYYGEFGSGDYKIRKIYRGQTEKVKNVVINNINITTALSSEIDKYSIANNLGIINAENVKIINCKITNAPQSNVAIVNDTNQFKNIDVFFKNCEFSRSKQHNVRVISYNKGSILGNTVTFDNCKFKNVRGKDLNQKEIKNESLNLWYRGLGTNKNSLLQIKDCFFDNSGYIYVNGQYANFMMTNSTVDHSIVFQLNTSKGAPDIQIKNSRFYKKGDFKSLKQKKITTNKEKKLKNPFVETEFGIIYPSTLKYNIR